MPSPPCNLDLWVLAGQSNMVGRAPLHGALSSNERVWAFANNGRWEIAAEPLHRLWESFAPVHRRMLREGVPPDQQHLPDEHWAKMERQERSGAGLGLSFGIAMTQAHGRPIGLIPCAHGGVSLYQWSPEHSDNGAADNLYSAMIESIHRACDRGTLKGILWYQGETDVMRLADAETYAQRFDDWVRKVRLDTGHNDLPVIVVQLGRAFDLGADNRAINLVRQAQAQLPHRLPRTAVTSAIDLGLCDACHICTAGLIRLGRRMARQALRLTDRPDIPAGPHVKSIEPTVDHKASQHALRIILDGVTGRLRPAENIGGFSIQDNDEMMQLWSADVRDDDTDGDPNTACIRLLLNQNPSPTLRLAYGQGMAPQCNLVDDADMPLCAFASAMTR